MAKKSMIAKAKRPAAAQGPGLPPLLRLRSPSRASCGASRLCRICFRERALLGELPGVTKSSW